MTENFSEKRKATLRNVEKTKNNYSVVKGDIAKVRGNLDFIEVTIADDIDKLDKAKKLFEALPEEQISQPSPALESLITSGTVVARSACAHSEHFKDSFQKFRDETDLLLGTTTVVDMSGNAVLNISSSAAKTLTLQYPQIGELVQKLDLPSPFEKRKELESELRKIDERLANMFVGAWQTMGDTSKRDRYRQASHSMRDLLSQFLDLLAPPEKVKEAEWYEPELDEHAKNPRKKPTQRQRAKYAIMGERSEKTIDEEDLKMITALIDDTRKAYEDLSEPAHARNEEIFNLTESYMERCEEVIRTIL